MKNSKTKNWKVVVDKDSAISYEKIGLSRSLINIFLIPILNILPKKSIHLIKKTHSSAKEVVDHKTSHKALEVLYNTEYREKKKSFLNQFFHWIWFQTNNSKTARNRLKITKREIKKCIEAKISKGEKVRILSIASGSARAIIETIEVLNKDIQDKESLSVVFLDKSPEAISYSKNLARNIEMYNLSWVNDTIGNFFRSNDTRLNFDLIEVVGLMDYFIDSKVEEVYTNCFNHLKKGGMLITANINKNSEVPFVTRVIDWKMIYRTAEDVGELLKKANIELLKKANIELFYEPLKIHSVAVAHK